MRVECETTAGGQRVAVCARLRDRSDALGAAVSVETHSIEVRLRRIVRRGEEIRGAQAFIHAHDVEDVGVEARHERPGASLTRDAIQVPPAVPLAEPQKRLAAVNPADVCDVYPGLDRKSTRLNSSHSQI